MYLAIKSEFWWFGFWNSKWIIWKLWAIVTLSSPFLNFITNTVKNRKKNQLFSVDIMTFFLWICIRVLSRNKFLLKFTLASFVFTASWLFYFSAPVPASVSDPTTNLCPANFDPSLARVLCSGQWLYWSFKHIPVLIRFVHLFVP